MRGSGSAPGTEGGLALKGHLVSVGIRLAVL